MTLSRLLEKIFKDQVQGSEEIVGFGDVYGTPPLSVYRPQEDLRLYSRIRFIIVFETTKKKGIISTRQESDVGLSVYGIPSFTRLDSFRKRNNEDVVRPKKVYKKF